MSLDGAFGSGEPAVCPGTEDVALEACRYAPVRTRLPTQKRSQR
ncbi:hypothetical protein OSJ20_07910 [Mycobacterium ulcerans]|nr:hypothetical protein [Mycobacterium pseudoshottsii]EPQ47826.1 hypothetical protein MMSP_3587 [Mycobacterium sp. 012931]EPQ76345.1 hypothetical protein MMMB2_1006 [Mycobacterium marinum MB2]MEB4073032.1 hypothetical protein [Mycobacterium ulcerans]GAQ34651.1 hypothetical protein MPS_2219 [Mycobacterium pseudoshottsii JCM 15466]MEB4102058.1 hypothetical protein [Mycobacterium ulcerans]